MDFVNVCVRAETVSMSMQLCGLNVFESVCSCCLGPQRLTDVFVCFLEDEYLNNFLNDLSTSWTRSLELV